MANTLSGSSALAKAAERLLQDLSGRGGKSAAELRATYGGVSGATADELRSQYGGTGSGTGGMAQTTQTYPDYGDYYQGAGYQAAEQAQKKALDTYISQIVGEVQQHTAAIEQQAGEAARQAYIGYMRAKGQLPQQLSAKGYSGGMADSYLIGLEADLQSNQRDIELNRQDAVNQLKLAALSAKSQATREAVQKQADLALAAANAWNSYLAKNNSGTVQKQAAGQGSTAARQQGKRPFEWIESMIQGGTLPDQNIISLPGLSQGERDRLEQLISAEEWMK